MGRIIMYWWPLSVRLSVCHVPEPNSGSEGHGKLKIGGKEAHDTGDPAVTSFRGRKVKHLPPGREISAPHSMTCVFYRVYVNVQQIISV